MTLDLFVDGKRLDAGTVGILGNGSRMHDTSGILYDTQAIIIVQLAHLFNM